MEIGKSIRYFREQSGYSQRKLAELLHVSERTIGHYETGTRTPNIHLLENISNVLNINIKELFNPILSFNPNDKCFFKKDLLNYIDFKPINTKKSFFEFKGDTHFHLCNDIDISKYPLKQFIVTKMNEEFIYFSIQSLKQVVSVHEENLTLIEIEGKSIPIFDILNNLSFTRKFCLIFSFNNGFTFHGKNEFGILVGDVIEILDYEITNESIKFEIEEFYEILNACVLKTKFIPLDLYMCSLRFFHRNKEMLNYSNHTKELFNLMKNKASKSIINTKIQDVLSLSGSFTEEDYECFRISYEETSKLLVTDIEKERFLNFLPIEKLHEFLIKLYRYVATHMD